MCTPPARSRPAADVKLLEATLELERANNPFGCVFSLAIVEDPVADLSGLLGRTHSCSSGVEAALSAILAAAPGADGSWGSVIQG